MRTAMRRPPTMHRSRLLAFGAMVLGALVVHGCAVVAGRPAVLPTLLLLVTLLASARSLGGPVEAVLLAVLVLDWAAARPDPLTWWSLPAAAGLLVVHASAAVVNSGPPGTPTAPGLAAVTARRSALVVLGCAPVAAATLLLRGADADHGSWLLVLPALLALAAAGGLLARQLNQDHDGR